MIFKASVKSRSTGKISLIEITQTSKANAIRDIRGNGYMVDPNKVKSPDVFDYILDNTNATPEDWKYINKIPQDGEDVSDWIIEGMKKDRIRQDAKFEKMLAESKERHQQFLSDIGMSEEEFQADIQRRKATTC